jgi:Tyrosine phosphatase family
MIKRFLKVNDNLYRGGAPSVQDIIDLKKMGINKIVSLDEQVGNKIDRMCKLLNIEHVIIPLDVSKPRSILSLLGYNLYDLLIKNGPTFVHCHEGKDRTGTVVAMFKCKYEGWSFNKAVREAIKLGFGLGLPPQTTQMYLELIREFCAEKNTKDQNNADIIENSKSTSKWDGTVVDKADISSFAPYLDFGTDYPYNSEYDQVPAIDGVGPTANIGTGFVEV